MLSGSFLMKSLEHLAQNIVLKRPAVYHFLWKCVVVAQRRAKRPDNQFFQEKGIYESAGNAAVITKRSFTPDRS